MPTGCGTWPAFWTTGPHNPNFWELDVVDGVNRDTRNIVSVYTAPGACTLGRVNPGISKHI